MASERLAISPGILAFTYLDSVTLKLCRYLKSRGHGTLETAHTLHYEPKLWLVLVTEYAGREIRTYITGLRGFDAKDEYPGLSGQAKMALNT